MSDESDLLGDLGIPLDDTTVAEPAASEDSVSRTIGRYKLLERLGEGGCGVVYVAEQTEPVRRRVALKVIKLGMDTKQVVARFEAERQALAMMDHPNIAKVLDAGTTPTGRPYFVMELVRGIEIAEYCDQANLGVRERLDLFVKVCQAIQHAHQKGIIHRDIKPSNILVTLHDGVAVPKVIDFGIAKATEGRLTDATVYTQLHQFIGTPAFMSPEQAEMSGLDIDTRSDIYSMGVLLYVLLTGKTPFESKDLIALGIDEMRRTIRETEPMRPSTRFAALKGEELTTTARRRSIDAPRLIHLLKGDLDWVVMKCLEKDRSRRYESASGLAADVQRYLDNEPVVARPPSAVYRFGKMAKRNRLLFASTAALMLALVVGIGVSLWLAGEARQAQGAADRQRHEADVAKQVAQSNEVLAVQQRSKAERQEIEMRRRAYAADMNAASHAARMNSFGRVVELLDRYRPVAGQEELRGWEWRYLWGLCQSDAEGLVYHLADSESVRSVSLHKEGRLAAVGGRQKVGAIIWDRSTGAVVAKVGEGEDDALVSFSADGARLLVATARWLRIWDCRTRVITASKETTKRILGAVFTADGNEVRTLTEFGEIGFWKADGLLKSRAVPVPEAKATLGSHFAVTWDGRFAAVPVAKPGVLPSSVLVMMDLEAGKVLWRLDLGGDIRAIAFTRDDTVVAVAAGESDGTIRLIERDSSREQGRLMGHSAWVSSMVSLPDQKTLVSASADQTIRLWDLESRKETRLLKGHSLAVWALAVSDDGKTLFSGGMDGDVLSWDLQRQIHHASHWTQLINADSFEFEPGGGAMLVVDKEAGKVIRRTGFSYEHEESYLSFPPGADTHLNLALGRFVSCATNGTVKVVNVRDGKLLGEFKSWNSWPETFAQDGKRLWVGRSTSQADWRSVEMEEWDLENARMNRTLAGVRWPFCVRADEWILSLDDQGGGLMYDLKSGKVIRSQLSAGKLARPHGSAPITVSEDGRFVAISHELGKLSVWDVSSIRSGEAPRRMTLLGEGTTSYCSSSFTEHGSRLAAGGHGAEAVTMWSSSGFQKLLTLQAEGDNFEQIRMSPEDSVLTAVNARRQVHFWRAPTWSEIAAKDAKKKQRESW